jgi:hypothetical protein
LSAQIQLFWIAKAAEFFELVVRFFEARVVMQTIVAAAL